MSQRGPEGLESLPDDQFAEVEGQVLRFWDIGSGPAPLLIHGLEGSVLRWRHKVGALANCFRVIALGLLGNGLFGMPTIRCCRFCLLPFGQRQDSLLPSSDVVALSWDESKTEPCCWWTNVVAYRNWNTRISSTIRWVNS